MPNQQTTVLVNNTPLSPWTGNVDAAGYTLTSLGLIDVSAGVAGAVAARLRAPGVTANNVQLRFYGGVDATDLWAIGTDIQSANGSKNLHLYSFSAGVVLTVKESNGYVGLGTGSPTSPLQVVGLPSYASNAAAITGGLTAGAFYRNGDNVCVVH